MKNLWFKLSENAKIETERLLLRPFMTTDTPDVYEYNSDIEVTRYVYPVCDSLEEAGNSLASWALADPLGKYAIEHKKDKKVIGVINFHHYDTEAKTVEVGYVLNRKYWGHGYAVESLNALLDLAFRALEFNFVFAKSDERNTNSIKVLEKAGMEFIAKLPYAGMDILDKDLPCTDIMYGITRDSYLKKQ